MIFYALFFCVQSSISVSCDHATYDALSLDGGRHYIYAYSQLSECLDRAHELSKTTEDRGRFFVASNKWYECRLAQAE